MTTVLWRVVADDDTAFGIQAMCGQPLRAADDGCNLDEALTFAYWVDSKLATDRHVVLFGVDGAGGRTLLRTDARRPSAFGGTRRLGAGRVLPSSSP